MHRGLEHTEGRNQGTLTKVNVRGVAPLFDVKHIKRRRVAAAAGLAALCNAPGSASSSHEVITHGASQVSALGLGNATRDCTRSQFAATVLVGVAQPGAGFAASGLCRCNVPHSLPYASGRCGTLMVEEILWRHAQGGADIRQLKGGDDGSRQG